MIKDKRGQDILNVILGESIRQEMLQNNIVSEAPLRNARPYQLENRLSHISRKALERTHLVRLSSCFSQAVFHASRLPG